MISEGGIVGKETWGDRGGAFPGRTGVKVDEPEFVGDWVDEEIGGLDVVVEEASVVEVQQTLGHLDGEGEEKVEAQRVDEKVIDWKTNVGELVED